MIIGWFIIVALSEHDKKNYGRIRILVGSNILFAW